MFTLVDGFFSTPSNYLILPANFIVAALLVGQFHLPPGIYGLIVALPFIINFLQAFVMPVMSRRFALKKLVVTGCVVMALAWGALGLLLPFFPRDNPRLSGVNFVIFFVIISASVSVVGVNWTSWVREWVPASLRGAFFGKRNRAVQFSQIAFVFLAGWLLDHLNGALIAFQILFVVSMLMRVISAVCIQKVHPPPPGPAHVENVAGWRGHLRILLRTPPYIWFVLYGMAWGFAANCSGAFFPVFIYTIMNLSAQDLGILVILSSLGGALSFPAWGALGDRFGNKPVMLLCMIAWQLQNFAWCFLVPGHNWPLYIMWSFGGIVAGGFTVTFFNIQLKVIPPAAKTLAISINLALTSVVTAIAPILSGAILEYFLNGDPAHDLAVYRFFFLSTPVLGLLACLILRKVHEPAASPLSSVVGAMRNLRTLSSILGVGFLVDTIFLKRPGMTKKETDK